MENVLSACNHNNIGNPLPVIACTQQSPYRPNIFIQSLLLCIFTELCMEWISILRCDFLGHHAIVTLVLMNFFYLFLQLQEHVQIEAPT